MRIEHAARTIGRSCHHGANSGRRNRTSRCAAGSSRPAWEAAAAASSASAGYGLLAQLGRQPRRQLEVELRVPVFGIFLDGLAELFLGAPEPAEARLRRFLDARLLEERARGPEMRRRFGGGALREIDHLVVAFQPVQRPEVIA